MNLSHIIHEFSFGPYFPAIAQPLDMTYTIADARECCRPKTCPTISDNPSSL